MRQTGLYRKWGVYLVRDETVGSVNVMADKTGTDDARESLGGLCVLLRASGTHASLIDDDKVTILKALDRKDELEEFEEVAGRLSDVNANLLERIKDLEIMDNAATVQGEIIKELKQELTTARHEVS